MKRNKLINGRVIDQKVNEKLSKLTSLKVRYPYAEENEESTLMDKL